MVFVRWTIRIKVKATGTVNLITTPISTSFSQSICKTKNLKRDYDSMIQEFTIF
jgi:hypothetical protein